MLNLLTNAIEASFQNDKILVKTYCSGSDNIIFEVEDHGIGIKSKDKDKIFSDFYTNKIGGTGLGLTVCKMLLEGTGAKIEFESYESKSTKFFVIIPLKSLEEKNES